MSLLDDGLMNHLLVLNVEFCSFLQRFYISVESGIINLDTCSRFGLKLDDNTLDKTKKI